MKHDDVKPRAYETRLCTSARHIEVIDFPRALPPTIPAGSQQTSRGPLYFEHFGPLGISASRAAGVCHFVTCVEVGKISQAFRLRDSVKVHVLPYDGLN